MSLFDLILEQQIILVSIILALVPLLAALILLVLSRMRKLRARRAAEKQADLAAAKQSGRRRRRGAAAVSEIAVEPQPVGAAAAYEASTEAYDEDEEDEEDPEAEEDEEGGIDPESLVASEMQSLLEDVFFDEEAFARYEVLLDGKDNVDIQALASLAEEVAAQLHARSAQTA